ncbi:MAG: class I SAM-dependent methyltransferase [Elusimicrobia bacterium]|nr:class I SAM-dependent methyltransferase [Elusimicrobiota bacterium]
MISQQVVSLYRSSGFGYRLYALLRLKLCPLIALEKHIPREGAILDCGCGVGLLSAILSLLSPGRMVQAFDSDASKIAVARTIEKQLSNVTFTVSSLDTACFSAYTTVIMCDMLYLIDFSQQECILRRCFDQLPHGALLVIMDTDTRPRWKYFINNIHEAIMVKLLRFTRASSFQVRSAPDFIALLKNIGFAVTLGRMDHGYIYAHIAYVCKKY